MNTPIIKLPISLIFIAVLLIKMFIIVSPAFSNSFSQEDIQTEKGAKNDKDDSEKEPFKIKNAFDEEYLTFSNYLPLIGLDDDVAHDILFLHPIYAPDHLAAVPTPPPDYCLS